MAGGSSNRAKESGVIRVRVPLDLHAVGIAGSSAFALATPLRVRDVLALAVREALGARAPADKCARTMARMLAGLAAGDYTVDVDGRAFADGDAVVVCADVAMVRFYVDRPATADFEYQP
jgi:hypothetical protein